MATQLIPATSSAPTLRELAARASEDADARQEARTAEAAEQRREQSAVALLERISACLGITVSRDDVLFDHALASPLVVVDGITLALCGSPDFGLSAQLEVATTCGRGCGVPLWTPIDEGADSLALLHSAVSLDGTETHDYDCLKREEDLTPAPRVKPGDGARLAIATIETAGERLAQAIRTVQDLEDGRSIEKSAAVRRIMQTTNEETQKPHSASSAEKVVETDAEYMAYRRRQADAEVEKQRAYAAYAAAQRTADLEIEIYRAWEHNR